MPSNFMGGAEHTGVLAFNRLHAIDNVMRKAEADPGAWATIVTGNGRGFCPGAASRRWRGA